MNEHTTQPAEPAPTTAGAALAQTLDEATLRRVFPNAPAQLDVPRDVNAIFRHQLTKLGGDQHTLLMIAAFGVPALGVIVGLIGLWSIALILIILSVATVAIVLLMTYSKAKHAFFGMYAAARGLTHHEKHRLSADVPLFGKGDKREWPRVLTGTIDGQEATLGHYTYTDISTDSDGDRSETDYHFTFLEFRLPENVAARFSGVYCAPKGISFGALQDKLQHDRAVTLESTEFHKRYSLRVVDGQDDIALYELFSPPFIQLLSTQIVSYWEQRGTSLVCWQRQHEHEAADLDRFCLESWHVLQRYLEEWQ